MNSTKRCYRCGESKGLALFSRDRYRADGLTQACKPCRWEQQQDWRRRNPDKYRAQHQRKWIRRRFGISVEEYADLVARYLEEQDGKCAICAARLMPRRYGLDHSHSSGRIRGVLCLSCNSRLGFYKDDAEWLGRASAYLTRAQ